MKYKGLIINKMYNTEGHNFITTFYFRFENSKCVIEYPFSIETENKKYDKIKNMMLSIDELFKNFIPDEIDFMIFTLERILKGVKEKDYEEENLVQ